MGGTGFTSMTSAVFDTSLDSEKKHFLALVVVAGSGLLWNVLTASLKAGSCPFSFIPSAFLDSPCGFEGFTLASLALRTFDIFFTQAINPVCFVNAHADQRFFLSHGLYSNKCMLLRSNCFTVRDAAMRPYCLTFTNVRKDGYSVKHAFCRGLRALITPCTRFY